MKGYKFTIGEDGKVRKVCWDTEEGYLVVSAYAKDFSQLNHKDTDSKIFILNPPTAEELVDEINGEKK